MFAPGLGVSEDPATATAAGPLGAYLSKWGILGEQSTTSFTFEQGFEIGRPSFIHVMLARTEDRVTSLRVGGQCVAIGEGRIDLEI
jgi:trans-2,3-dihydro-3-hydroxyanthranilate isomerase